MKRWTGAVMVGAGAAAALAVGGLMLLGRANSIPSGAIETGVSEARRAFVVDHGGLDAVAVLATAALSPERVEVECTDASGLDTFGYGSAVNCAFVFTYSGIPDNHSVVKLCVRPTGSGERGPCRTAIPDGTQPVPGTNVEAVIYSAPARLGVVDPAVRSAATVVGVSSDWQSVADVPSSFASTSGW